ncbi:MAG: citrate (Si)-synthase [Epsilonproteobacteria bacterium]|nr:MAG: citrate (Si)-synthase [Campylobacterota bacterium]RLA67798.1 MAG: citrate (Si)-synthase [Campylobacterota bacterium]
MVDHMKIKLNGTEIELPVIEGTENEKAIDISKLRAETGHITLDNGFGNTGSCKSKITFLDGEKGILRYRGYPIEQLADNSSFLEVSYLLNHGELPNKVELEKFEKTVKEPTLPVGICDLLDDFPKTAHPMGVAASAIVALSAFVPRENLDITKIDKDEVLGQLMESISIIAARFFRHRQGKKIIGTDPNLSYVENLYNMMFDEIPSEKVKKALEVLLILHADHEQNCSASAVRVIGSAQTNPYACISGGISALWGALHGGANQAVMEMLQDIQDNGGDYRKALDRAKDKEDPFRLMGFGHRVYKNFDPRAKIIKKACDTVLDQLGVSDPLLDVAKGLEKVALEDPYFVDRKLYPNVDFYSGIIYRALGIPTDMFTVMFAIGRLPGWFAQWRELAEFKGSKIARPRQVYMGENERDYIPMEKR